MLAFATTALISPAVNRESETRLAAKKRADAIEELLDAKDAPELRSEIACFLGTEAHRTLLREAFASATLEDLAAVKLEIPPGLARLLGRRGVEDLEHANKLARESLRLYLAIASEVLALDRHTAHLSTGAADHVIYLLSSSDVPSSLALLLIESHIGAIARLLLLRIARGARAASFVPPALAHFVRAGDYASLRVLSSIPLLGVSHDLVPERDRLDLVAMLREHGEKLAALDAWASTAKDGETFPGFDALRRR